MVGKGGAGVCLGVFQANRTGKSRALTWALAQMFVELRKDWLAGLQWIKGGSAFA